MSVNTRLCRHEDLPEWCKDNGFIVTGYRRPGESQDDLVGTRRTKAGHNGSTVGATLRNRKANGHDRTDEPSAYSAFQHDSVSKCWQSVWGYVHNETVNIHTHLWGVFLSGFFVALHLLHHLESLPQCLRSITHNSIFLPAIFTKGSSTHLPAGLRTPRISTVHDVVDHSDNDWKDTFGFVVFLMAAIACLAFSASFHTLSCHSRALARNFNALDYVGIVVMIVGSFLPALHYGFYCHPHWQALYAVGISALGSAAAWVVVHPKYATPHYRPYRTAIFIFLGLSAVLPVAHGLKLYGFEVLDLTMGLKYIVTSGMLYIAGALLYALRVPERFAPGRFDYFGASHQIFHFFILMAAFSHYISLRQAYTFWHTVEFGDITGKGAGQVAVCQALEAWRKAS